MTTFEGNLRSAEELKNAISNISPADLNSAILAGNETNTEVIGKLEERAPQIRGHTKIRFSEEQRVILVNCRPKGADHRKMGHRQVANPWRRYGSLKTIHQIGGWITGSGRKGLIRVQPGTRLPNEPKVNHFTPHQDKANLNQPFFKFRIDRTASSQEVSHSIGMQIAKSFQEMLKMKPIVTVRGRSFYHH
ncbi:hypothetical protein M3Y97_00098900 [Aphelenchoides bicaudatus]|nr:hypothetical protein M3Y97_00098900 [Aphelenchoides bicaudatus]